ncbi:inorganic diphosphatase [Mesorhizobium sp. BAC0120]|uniref:inorganic diphosphatase n=1 Tax=Mesorhizobium sp. BAC0120 TaxID=3090670 RepID=UPI00298BD0C3|nr:inorganic diphosphatase [Mesorhizobium sp. BAC0120]MDW6025351.1 inorganic diphosphatase [Mesorhizobium sp. BAC0120]
MRKFLLAGIVAASVFTTACSAFADFVNPFEYPQPKEGSDFFAVIEIPAGSFTKYEIDAENGHIIVDRYQSMPVIYPANYGSIPSSLGGDGDPLDVLVYTREPIVPGALIKVRAIGVLKMIDGGETDDRIVAVPASDIDPTYDAVKSINNLPQIERARLESFFRVYKQLPAGRKEVVLNGFEDVAVAQELVSAAITNFRGKNQ